MIENHNGKYVFHGKKEYNPKEEKKLLEKQWKNVTATKTNLSSKRLQKCSAFNFNSVYVADLFSK